MDLTTSTSAALWLDRCGAFGLFDRIEVYDYLGGTLIEQTNNLPALMTLLGDLNYRFMDFNGKLQATQGYDGSNIGNTTKDLDALEIRASNTGTVLVPLQGAASNTFLSWEFAIPIPSFLGIFSDKYVPLHNGFSIDFFLNDAANAFVSRTGISDATSVSIKQTWLSNIEWCCQVMELGEIAESMVQATIPAVIHSTQFRHFRDIILGGGAQSTFRLDLNLNVVSLRNIRFSMRPSSYTGLSFPNYGYRIRNFLQNFNFQYGSSYLPEIAGITCRSATVPVSKNGYTAFLGSAATNDPYKAQGYSQSYMELSKTVADGKQITINSTEYRVDTECNMNSTNPTDHYNATSLAHPLGSYVPVPLFLSDTSGTLCGKFAGGIDTRLSKKNTVSGIDTNGLLVSVNGQFDRDYVSSMLQADLDLWAEFDAFVQVIPGVATTVTF
jgi:hypothetical protein